MIFIYLLALSIFILFTNKFLLKNNILINETGDIHQKFSSKSSVPLTGGIFIFLGFLFYYKGIYSFILFSFIILNFQNGKKSEFYFLVIFFINNNSLPYLWPHYICTCNIFYKKISIWKRFT